MVTQVDWWQIKNAPPLGGDTFDNYPVPDGPFTGSPVLMDNGTGIFVVPGPLVELALASLVQAGVIGTAGGQQLLGPFYLGTANGPFGPPGPAPDMSGSRACVVLQDGFLGFYDSAEGDIPAPNAVVDYDYTTGSLRLQTGALSMFLGTDPFGQPATCSLIGLLPTFSVNGNYGVYTSLIDGTPVDGGIIVGTGSSTLDWSAITGTPTTLAGYGISDAVLFPPTPTLGYVLTWNGSAVDWEPGGGSGSVPWSSITGTPTTLAGYGITDAVGVGSAAGGDLAGTYPSPTVGTLQSFPLSLFSPSAGDVLTWSGTAIDFAPAGGGGLAIGTPVSGGTANRILFEDGSANLADSGQFQFQTGSGLYVSNSNFLAQIADFSGGGFYDGTNNVQLSDNNFAVNVLAGSIQVLGTTGNAINWAAPASAPGSTQALSPPSSCYGQGVIGQWLGNPDTWLRVSQGGPDYLLPAYLV